MELFASLDWNSDKADILMNRGDYWDRLSVNNGYRFDK